MQTLVTGGIGGGEKGRIRAELASLSKGIMDFVLC